MSSQYDAIVKGLMAELADEDDAIRDAARALEQARVRFEVASQKYAAVRDVVAAHLGHNPTNQDALKCGVQFFSEGRFRFIHMAIGDAAVAALRESDEPMALEEIATAVVKGGLRVPGAVRAVNAALMNTSGVEKTEDGKYRYVEPVEEELPFE